jgi:hypothetical protein
MSGFKNLNMAAPVYVTRKNADSYIASYSMTLWMTLLAMMLVWLNIVVWGIVGLIEAGVVLF